MHVVQGGDPRAFEVLYDRHGGAAFSLAYRMVGKRAVAEDIVQEAFLSIWRSRVRYERARGSVRTWVLGIVHHRTIDALRRATWSTSAGEQRRGDRGASRGEGADRRRGGSSRGGAGGAGGAADAARRAVQVIELAYYGGFTHTRLRRCSICRSVP